MEKTTNSSKFSRAYIAPRLSQLQINDARKYAQEHRMGFRAFWEAPYIIREVGIGTEKVKFQIIRINELHQLLKKDKSLKKVIDEVPFRRIIELLLTQIYTATELGEVSINEMTLDAAEIPTNYQEEAIQVMKDLGSKYGLTFKEKACEKLD